MQIAIAVEPSNEMLDNLSKSFNTVFAFSINPPVIKKRNIIYRELIENVDQIPEVGFICVEEAGIVHIPAFQTIFQHHKPTLMIRSGEYPSKKIARWLNEHVRYEMVDIAKHHQLWKIKQ
jgi:hypothetical protein